MTLSLAMAFVEADNQTFHGFIDVPEASLDVLPSVVTPLLYRRQPFRLIGLPVLASERETSKRLDLLRQSLELGTAEYRWSFAPGFAPSEDEFVEVSRALKDPRLRFACELFWFWPESFPETSADAALDCLARRATDDAVNLWRASAAGGSVVAAHNLAVYFHLRALSGERVWSPRDEQRRIAWDEAFARWQTLAADESFWTLVEKRLHQLDEPQLPSALLAPLRTGFLAAIAGINAQLASQAATREDTALARWHADLLRRTFGAFPDGHLLLEGCMRPLAVRLEANRETTEACAKTNPSLALAAARTLLDADSRELDLIRRICGEDSFYLRELNSTLATAILDALVRYQRATDDNHGCLPCFDRLANWSLPPELAERIRQAREVIAQAALAEPLALPDAEILFELGNRQLAIGPDGVRLDDRVIPADHFTGFRHAPPSDDAARSLVLGWWSIESVINLGSPPHLPGGDEGAAVYERIVAACERWLVPGLVARLAGLIQSGESLSVGTASLTSDGLLLPAESGLSNDRVLVRFPDVQHFIQGDQLTVNSRSDDDLSATLSMREDWNAVVLLRLIAALTPL